VSRLDEETLLQLFSVARTDFEAVYCMKPRWWSPAMTSEYNGDLSVNELL